MFSLHLRHSEWASSHCAFQKPLNSCTLNIYTPKLGIRIYLSFQELINTFELR